LTQRSTPIFMQYGKGGGSYSSFEWTGIGKKKMRNEESCSVVGPVWQQKRERKKEGGKEETGGPEFEWKEKKGEREGRGRIKGNVLPLSEISCLCEYIPGMRGGEKKKGEEVLGRAH